MSVSVPVISLCPFSLVVLSPSPAVVFVIIVVIPCCSQEGEWKELMREEFEAARRQGATKAEAGDDGIVLLVSKAGKVLRRGVGVPVWNMIQEDVDSSSKAKEKA